MDMNFRNPFFCARLIDRAVEETFNHFGQNRYNVYSHIKLKSILNAKIRIFLSPSSFAWTFLLFLRETFAYSHDKSRKNQPIA